MDNFLNMSDTVVLKKYKFETWSKQKYSRLRYIICKFGTGIPQFIGLLDVFTTLSYWDFISQCKVYVFGR